MAGDVAYANRLEARYAGSAITADAQYLRTDSNFVNTAAPVLAGREEAAAHIDYRIDAATQIRAEAQHSARVGAVDRRDGAMLSLRHAFNAVIRAELGLRTLDQRLLRGNDTLRYGGGGVRARVDVTAPQLRRTTGFAEVEKRLGDAGDWRALLGADVKLTDKLHAYARSEFDAGALGPYEVDPYGRRIATVAGFRSTYGDGQQVYSEYRVRDGMSGREALAAVGLRNRWRVAPGVVLDGSAEREVPMAGSDRVEQFALTSGVVVTRNPKERMSARLEFRQAAGTDLLFGTFGYLRKVATSTAVLAQSNMAISDGGDRVAERVRFGLAHRSATFGGWNGLFRYEQRFDRTQEIAGASSRSAHTFASNADFQPSARLQLRVQGVQQFRRDPAGVAALWSGASLVGVRGTYELTHRFDVGSVVRTLRNGGGAGWSVVGGPEVGVTAAKNLRVSAGYSVRSIPADLLLDRESTSRGLYMDISFKLDELFLGLGNREGAQPKR
jgi:hypothetical protein